MGWKGRGRGEGGQEGGGQEEVSEEEGSEIWSLLGLEEGNKVKGENMHKSNL